MNTTFYDIISKHSFDELWYILFMRHNLQHKPVKAERMYELYSGARDELISLHGQRPPDADHTLVCTLSSMSEFNEGCAVFMDCTLLAPSSSDDEYSGKKKGELQHFAADFNPWIEVIDLPISTESLEKYGEIVCAAELLYEFTFDGYSAKKINENIAELMADIKEADEARENGSYDSSDEEIDFDDLFPAPDPAEIADIDSRLACQCARQRENENP
jgi:hypothetical protein